MNKVFAFFDESSGAIASILRGSETVAAIQGGRYLEVSPDVLDTTHYITGGKAVEKTPFDVRHTIAGLAVTFPALPAGAIVEVEGASITTDDDPLEIVFDVPGTYRIQIRGLVSFLSCTVEVTING